MSFTKPQSSGKENNVLLLLEEGELFLVSTSVV